MPRASNSILIDAQPHYVWKFFEDPVKITEWSLITDFRFEGEERGEGARFHVVEVVGRRTNEYDCEVTSWEPGEKFLFKCLSKEASVTGAYLLDSRNQGCLFTIEEEIQAKGGIIGTIVGRLFIQKKMEEVIEGNLERLKKLVERRVGESF